jgi:very-short-patch-repair endonuclease
MSFGERRPLRNESDLRRWAAEQHGVFSLAQALETGISSAGVTRRVRAGVWERVLPRVYRIVGGPAADRQPAMAAALWAGPGAVLSHSAVAALWEIPGPRSRRVELWVPAPRAPRSKSVIVHRGLRVDRADRTRLGPIPVTTPIRTLIDLSARMEDDRLLEAMEDVLRRDLATPERLAARLAVLRESGRPGAGRLQRLLVDRDAAPSESVLEAKVWLVLCRSGLLRPVRQHWIVTPGGRYRFDFAWPDCRLALEVDGWEHHGSRAAFGKDRVRLSEATASGWRVLVATWDVVVHDPRRLLRWVDDALARPAA